MECEDVSSNAAIHLFYYDQYIPEERTSEEKKFNQQELNYLI